MANRLSLIMSSAARLRRRARRAEREVCEKRGDGKASDELAELFGECNNTLRIFVRNAVRDEHVAEEIVQETYLRMIGAVRDGEIANPRGYLFRTAHNLAIDHIRRRNLRVIDDTVSVDALSVASPAPTPEEVLSYAETSARFRRSIKRLPRKTRRVFYLRRYKELSIADISAVMQLSERMVYKHMERALKHLWRDLKSREDV